ncbi:MAG: hypothetical protein Q8Q17_03510 [bacterium]|nr:hypothetical protein [bacterium]
MQKSFYGERLVLSTVEGSRTMAMYLRFNLLKLKTKILFCVFASFVLFAALANLASAKTINLGSSGDIL